MGFENREHDRQGIAQTIQMTCFVFGNEGWFRYGYNLIYTWSEII